MEKVIDISSGFKESMIPGLSWGLSKKDVISILGAEDGEIEGLLIYDSLELYFDSFESVGLSQINIMTCKIQNKKAGRFKYGWLNHNLTMSDLCKRAYELGLDFEFKTGIQGFSLRISNSCYALTDDSTLKSGEFKIYKITYHSDPFIQMYKECYPVTSFLDEELFYKFLSLCNKEDQSINGMVKKLINQKLSGDKSFMKQ